MSGSLWVSWKNRILGNGGTEAFDPFDPHVLKSPPDPADSCALRTRCARADQGCIQILGTGVPDLIGDCVAARIGKLDRVGHTPTPYPPDPSHRHAADTRAIHWINPDRHHTPTASIGPELTHILLLEDDAR